MLNLLEQAKMISPDGKQMKQAEVMSKAAPLVGDLKWYPSNDTWSNKSLQEATDFSTTLGWRALNERKTGTDVLSNEVLDVIGMMEEFVDVDCKWVDTQPSPAMARFQKARHKLKLLAQSLNYAFLYTNNKITPKAPHGLAPRINTLGKYCVSAGGAAKLTSIYVVTHDEDGVYGVYPKALQAPGGDFMIKHDAGVAPRLSETSSGKMYVYDDHYEFVGGIVVANPACLGRVANIPSATADTVTIEKSLIALMNKMVVNENTIIYMNEDIQTALEVRNLNKGNNLWNPEGGRGLFGEKIPSYRGTPIKKIDSRILLNTEVEVV